MLKTKKITDVERTLRELWMLFAMGRSLASSPLKDMCWDGLTWYAPNIFYCTQVRHIERRCGSLGYLTLRGNFPEGEVDMGLMRQASPYLSFCSVERYQYLVAVFIGVQTEGNRSYFAYWTARLGQCLEMLKSWLEPLSRRPCRIRVAGTRLAGRELFVYVGDVGVAQGMVFPIGLAMRFRQRRDIGSLFVGRGSEATRLAELADSTGLDNVQFHDEIHPDEIPAAPARIHF